jgi:hypothetical protein
MKISGLRNCSVFLDTNILIYAFTTTRFTSACEELLEKVQNNLVTGYVNSTVIDEFFHKVLLMQVYTEKRLQPSDAIAFLKQNPESLADFSLPFEVTHEVLHDYGIIVLDTAPLMDQTLAVSRRYGLLFSDALHVASCTHYALDHLITNDRDFSRIDQVSVIAP